MSESHGDSASATDSMLLRRDDMSVPPNVAWLCSFCGVLPALFTVTRHGIGAADTHTYI